MILKCFCMHCRHQHGLHGQWKRWGEGIEQFCLRHRDWSHSECVAQPFWIVNDHLRNRCDGFRLLNWQVLGPLLVRLSHCAHIYLAAAGGFGLVKRTDSKHCSWMATTKIYCFRHYASRDSRPPNRILKVLGLTSNYSTTKTSQMDSMFESLTSCNLFVQYLSFLAYCDGGYTGWFASEILK